MVESIIVSSVFLIGLLGLLATKDVYLSKLNGARLARAGVMAYSMAGCEASDASSWLGPDLDSSNEAEAGREEQAAQGPHQGMSLTDDNATYPWAGEMVRDGTATSSGGEGFLNPIAELEVSRQVAVELGDEPREGTGSSEASLKSRSFITCGEPMRDGDLGAVIQVGRGHLKAIFSYGN